jgi:hypothetical protein
LVRVAFLVLLLANVILLLWGQGYFGTRQEGREPGRMAQQVASEKLHIAPVPATAQ